MDYTRNNPNIVCGSGDGAWTSSDTYFPDSQSGPLYDPEYVPHARSDHFDAYFDPEQIQFDSGLQQLPHGQHTELLQDLQQNNESATSQCQFGFETKKRRWGSNDQEADDLRVGSPYNLGNCLWTSKRCRADNEFWTFESSQDRLDQPVPQTSTLPGEWLYSPSTASNAVGDHRCQQSELNDFATPHGLQDAQEYAQRTPYVETGICDSLVSPADEDDVQFDCVLGSPSTGSQSQSQTDVELQLYNVDISSRATSSVNSIRSPCNGDEIGIQDVSSQGDSALQKCDTCFGMVCLSIFLLQAPWYTWHYH